MPPKSGRKKKKPSKKSQKSQKESKVDAKDKEKKLKMEQLKREMRLGSFNAKRSCKRWNEMVTHIKLQVMKEDLEAVRQVFDRQLDIKDGSIQFLFDSLNRSEEQRQLNTKSHLEQIDRLEKIFQKRVHDNEARYRNELNMMLSEANNQHQRIEHDSNEDVVYLKTIMFCMNEKLNELLMKTNSEALVKKNERRENSQNLIETIVTMTKSKSYIILKELQNVFQNYLTNSMFRNYENKKKKDDEDRRIIADLMSRVTLLTELKRKLREQVANLRKVSTQELETERKHFSDKFRIASEAFVNERKMCEKMLKLQVTEFDRTVKHLTPLCKKVQMIASLSKMCKKYETDEERLFYYTIDNSCDVECEKTCLEMHEMDKFWKKVGLVEMRNLQLIAERNSLLEQNKQLEEELKNRITCQTTNIEFIVAVVTE